MAKCQNYDKYEMKNWNRLKFHIYDMKCQNYHILSHNYDLKGQLWQKV